jgi:prephenate dehydrogenase
VNALSARVETLLVVGLGLIGGSLAKALRASGFAARITAYNRRRASLDYALAAGIIDAVPESLEAAVAEADLIVVGVPTLTVEHVFETVREHARPGVVVTDVASVKGSIVQAARRVFGALPPWLVPGHPIAGSEKSGVEAAQADLFDAHRVILTPARETDPAALELVESMWRLTGATVVRMDVEQHDRVLALTSHLPHLLAFALVDTLAQHPGSEDIFRFAAGGFRDFTRIASSDPVMWRDISIANSDALLEALDLFLARMMALRESLRDQDAAELEKTFARARAARETYLQWLEQAPRATRGT